LGKALLASLFRRNFHAREDAEQMVRRRRTGSGNWSRGVFAAFWILLGCLSGFYLFNVLTNPTLGGQLVKLTPAEQSAATASADGKAPSGDDLASIEENLRKLSQQVATLSGRLEGSETSATPAAPEAANIAAPPPVPAETATAAAEPPSPPQVQAPEPAQAEAPKPPEPVQQPEPKPIEQAAVEPKPSPPPIAEPAAPSEPPSVAVAPLDNLPPELQARANNPPGAPAPDAEAPAEAPAATHSPFEAPPAAPGSQPAEASGASPPEDAASKPQEPAAASTPPTTDTAASTPPTTETAALDPIELPPAANDGSTRYGIEIGVVAKQDGLRPLWREYLTNHAALVAGLQPRRVLAPDKKWRLIAGPFTSAKEATQACALFKKASRPCEATVYAGDSL
jgi:SPOR domain